MSARSSAARVRAYGRKGVGALLLLLLSAGALSAQRPSWVFLKRNADLHAVGKKLERSGATVRYNSRWLHAISVDADASAVAKIKRLKEVKGTASVGYVYPTAAPVSLPRSHAPAFPRSYAEAKSALRADFDSAFYGPNWKAIRQLGIPSAHTLGYTGRDIRIAIIDTGFEPAHEALSGRRIIAQRDFIHRDAVVADQPTDTLPNQEQHGTWVWSILGGHAPGKLVGPAFDAEFILAKVDVDEPLTTPPSAEVDAKADEDRWVAAVEWADSMGARIINSSLVYKNFSDAPSYTNAMLNGDLTRAAIMADEAARRGILVVTAMGNFGPDPTSLWTPADADSVIAVGAVDSLGVPSLFGRAQSSSRGPTADGRLKPEVVAPGIGIRAAHSRDLSSYDLVSGTSIATPFVSGGAAMFMQAWPNLTIMAVRNALMLSGTRAASPNNDVGFGVPNISSAILFPEGLLAFEPSGLNLENQLTTIQPTFTWGAPLINTAMRPVRYRLEIASDPAFNNIIEVVDTAEVFSATLRRPLKPAPALWWRVIGSAFPDVRRSTRVAGPFSVPDWVRLLVLNEPGGAFTDSLRPTFRWEALAAPPPSGPLVFDVQVLNAQTGAPVVTMRDVQSTSVQPPTGLTPNLSYLWRVIARSPAGGVDTVQSRFPFVVTSESEPPATLLYQNFPNPFPRPDLGQSSTRIWFDVNTRSTVELAVYDLRGRLIRQLIPAQPTCGTVELDPGIYGRSPGQPNPCVSTEWDARDSSGSLVPRGVYILRLRAGGTEQIKKVVFTGNQ